MRLKQWRDQLSATEVGRWIQVQAGQWQGDPKRRLAVASEYGYRHRATDYTNITTRIRIAIVDCPMWTRDGQSINRLG